MKGLLRKDLYMTWAYGRTLLLISAVFLATSAFMPSEENFFFVIYPVLMGGVLPVTLLSYDERSGWNRSCDALPVSRRLVVDERYLMSLLSFLVLYAVTLVVQAVVLLPRGRAGDLGQLAGLLPCFGLAAPAVMLPITLRWGVEKGRLVYFFFIGALVAAGLIFSRSVLGVSGAIGTWGVAAVLGGTVLFFIASWLLSRRLYEKREL
ncbi:MAG: ABC-2 transporter permease [Oscillospiraceae bacterium]|nr:ABC-2 transporter permease [Oscillospiraceae bacterium]